ncbi:four helix bundle protein [Aurantibacter aestuarii]|uniref:Four helix bundle protein n=1 Tax=Aurantibacter aestuarii TaxID=1266046 RepID=A0A2T1NDD1_9FLAO|nr:four helix bundle protein [Aurantibacter aestuarii]PSG90438.1 four helix bundle protein [Aurantibacter aestuarii]
MERKNIILDKSIEFSLHIIEFTELLESKRKFVIANQLLKSGTSIGANIHEAQNAESKADFIHKLKIAAKELEETKYWLLLCEKASSYTFNPIVKLQIKELGLILYKIISTSYKTKP